MINNETIKILHEKTGVAFDMCAKALEYANGNQEVAIAYIKAKTLAVATPNLTFEERVKSFLQEGKSNSFTDNLFYFGNHNHSENSNLRLIDCNIKVKDLIYKAVELGLKGISITDHECLSSHIEAIRIQKDLQKNGIDFKIGLGNEIYLVDSLEKVRDNYQGGGVTKFPHFVLVAKNAVGHEALRLLSSHAWHNSFKTGNMERVPTTTQFLSETMLNPKYKGSLIASSACLGGYIPIEYKKYCETNDMEHLNNIARFVNACKYIFGDDFYLEMQPSFNEEQISYNKFLIYLSEQMSVKLIFTTDTHYLTKEHRALHKSFLSSKEGDREVDDFYATTHLMTSAEVWDYFKDYIPKELFIEMVNNTLEIMDKIEFFDLEHSTIVPQIPIPPFNPINDKIAAICPKYEFISKFYNSEYLIDKYLIYQLTKGMDKRNQPYNDKNLSRIETELKEIWLISENIGSRLSSYYLLVQDIVDLMWTISLVGIARGSATGFYICYLLGITQMNPMKFNLPHWRHLTHERPELPDIDVDTESDKRQEIFELIKERYGYDKVLNIATFKTLKPKAAIQTAGRGLGYNNDEIQAISDMIPVERGNQWSIKDCIEGNEKEERKPIKEFINIIKEYDGLLESALSLEGLKTGRSIHASGLYIFDKPFINHNSIMKAPNGTDITCWCMEDSDYCSALKMDCLTIEALDKIRKTLELLLEDKKIEWQGTLRETYEKYLHPDVLEYEAPEMWEMLYKGEVINAFQYETPVGQQALSKIKPHKFVEAIAGNSLMRLSTKEEEQPLDRYVRFKKNIQDWYDDMATYNLTEAEIKILEKHLLHLYGIADTQEVVMQLAMDEGIANFTLKEANKLRKGIAKFLAC